MIRTLGAIAAPLIGFQLASHGAPPVVALISVVVAVVLWKTAGSPRAVTAHVHGGTTRDIARHEAGHVVVIKNLGGKVDRAEAHEDWGFVEGRPPRGAKPVHDIAVAAAGQVAAGTNRGCAWDDSLIEDALRRVPRRERDQTRKDGFDLAAQIIRDRAGEMRRYEKRLYEKGRL